MNLRRRKKLRRGEFASYGFGLEASFGHLTEDEREAAFWRAVEFAEGRGINIGGSLGPRWSLFAHACGCKVCGRAYESANEADRGAFLAYLIEAGATNVAVGRLEDLSE